MDKNSARERANRFVAECNGPLGALPVQRVLRSHLQFFVELRLAGSSWDQIAALLRSEGLTSKSGGQVSASVLRALYGKESKRALVDRGDGVQSGASRAADVYKPKPIGTADQASSSTTQALDREGIALRMQRAARLRFKKPDS